MIATKVVHDIAVRGNKLEHHNKQALMSSRVVFDENYKGLVFAVFSQHQ